MGKDKEPTIEDILKQSPRRAERNASAEELSKRIFHSIGKLFYECDGVDNSENRPKLKRIGSFPYMNDESLESQLYSVQFSPVFNKDTRSYSFLVRAKNEKQTELQPMLTVSIDRLEDASGRVISDMDDLRECEIVIERMLGFGRKHLPKTPAKS
jgi:hypothetical protein